MGVHVAAVFASGRSPRRPTELHIKQAVLWGLSSSLDTDPVSWQRRGGRVDGLRGGGGVSE